MKINLARYALWFAGASLLVMVLVLIVQRISGIQFPSAFAPVIPAMIAATVEGSKYAKETRESIPQPWLSAAAMTVLSILITAVLLLGALMPSMGERTIQLGSFSTVFAIYILFWLLCNRIFLAMGARNEWASQDRRGS
ncbi:MAG: ABZJ_00895 family protein [Pseudomonadota bacterium]